MVHENKDLKAMNFGGDKFSFLHEKAVSLTWGGGRGREKGGKKCSFASWFEFINCSLVF